MPGLTTAKPGLNERLGELLQSQGLMSAWAYYHKTRAYGKPGLNESPGVELLDAGLNEDGP